MIILKLYVRLHAKQNMEKGLRYELLNKCFKDYEKLLHKQNQVIHLETCEIRFIKSHVLYIKQKKLLKKYITI